MTIGFKEWLDVCSLLGSGATSLILRKGGIHEGRAGFSFKHERFFLFPTGFHQSASGLKIPAPECALPPASPENGVVIQYFAAAEYAVLLRDKEQIDRLAAHHCWTPEVVAERYSYSEKLEANCLSVAFVRVYQLPTPWHFPYQPSFGGCRSWLELPEPPANWEKSLVPVLQDATHAERRAALSAILALSS